MQLWGLASLNYKEQTSRLETRARVNVSESSPKSAGWKLWKGFYVAVLRQNCFFFGEPQSLLLQPSTDWMKPTQILESNFFTQSLLIKCKSHLKISS